MDAAVIGAGPAGLMATEVLAQGGARVIVYDAMPSAGRKFLMAGRGGLNLTHSEPLPAFMARYRAAASRLEPAIIGFSPDRLRAWSEALGQTTFVGSSGRVFPDSFKASPLLRAWLRRLDSQGVEFAFRHRWIGWDDRGRLKFWRPANCGFTVAWSNVFRDRFEGQPLKGAEFRFGDQAIRSEAIITRTGIEGGAIYALSAELREAIAVTGEATL